LYRFGPVFSQEWILARRNTQTNRGGRAVSPRTAMTIRELHLYVGMFVAPTLLFFAATGALQLFSLHEAHGDYQPPALIEKLGKLHKDQVFDLKAKKPTRAAEHDDDHDAAGHDDHDHAAGKSKTPTKVVLLKWLFLVAAVSLIVSTLLGIWMGVTQSRRKTLAWLLLALGAALPVLLIVL
jgi:hypothetical protein